MHLTHLTTLLKPPWTTPWTTPWTLWTTSWSTPWPDPIEPTLKPPRAGLRSAAPPEPSVSHPVHGRRRLSNSQKGRWWMGSEWQRFRWSLVVAGLGVNSILVNNDRWILISRNWRMLDDNGQWWFIITVNGGGCHLVRCTISSTGRWLSRDVTEPTQEPLPKHFNPPSVFILLMVTYDRGVCMVREQQRCNWYDIDKPIAVAVSTKDVEIANISCQSQIETPEV